MKDSTLILLLVLAAACSAVAAAAALVLLNSKRRKGGGDGGNPPPGPPPPPGGNGSNSSPGSRTGDKVATLEKGTITVNIRRGMGAGGQHALQRDYRNSFPIRDGCVVGFDIFFKEGFEFGCKGKIGGLQIGTGKASGGQYSPNGATHRMMWDRDGKTAYAYVYVPEGTGGRQPGPLSNPGKYGQSVWKNAFAGKLKTGDWLRVELGVKLNTPGKSDGAMFMRIEDEQQTQGNVYWRTSGTMDITKFGFGIFHGGPCKAERDSTLYIRNVELFEWKD